MLNADFIESLRVRLDAHPIYAAVATPGDLRVFMQHHVYSVWDFMSLIKYLQNEVAPARWPWMPGSDAAVQRFINELVLEEETDIALPGHDGHTSHFTLYLAAMREIGADADTPARYVETVGEAGIDAALASGLAPKPSAAFNRSTFDFLASGKPHTVAAALALVVAPCLLAPGKVTKLGSIAYANNGNGGGNGGNGNGGSSAGGNSSGNSNAGGNSGNSNAGGNSGNSNAGGGNPNAGPGNNNGKGNTDPGGKNSYTNTATGDTLSIEGDKITVIHRNGMKEKVQNGRFEMTDALGRTIVDRVATQEDVSRLLNL